MTDVQTELESRYDNIDVDRILARCQQHVPLSFAASKRCLYQAPEFIKRLPATEEVEEGSTVIFSCKVAGFPEPNITWYKDDDVIETESRAKFEADESGVHSIKIADVSKCDAGIYTIQASNLEGSSKSMLYISVKAKSKLRNRKNSKRGRKSRMIACAPMFPAIIEHVAEEQKEMLAFELQPESPLTHLYCTISRKAPVMWPAFLGEWAYTTDDMLHKDELDDIRYIDDEDVFEDEDTEVKSPYGMTFVSAAYAELVPNTEQPGTDDLCISRSYSSENNDWYSKNIDAYTNKVSNDVVRDEPGTAEGLKQEVVVKKYEPGTICCNGELTIGKNQYPLEETSICNQPSYEIINKVNVCDKLNNNDKENEDRNDSARQMLDNKSTNSDASSIQPLESETRQRFCEPDTVSVISVHRSYVKGETTSSVARRSPSPFSRSRNPVINTNVNSLNVAIQDRDTLSMQNVNNERTLRYMNQQKSYYKRFSGYLRSATSSVPLEDHFIQAIVFICASTFLGLCFDIPPFKFILNMLIVLFVKYALNEVFY